ncbi:exported hypothetical protein [Candidatus Sulfotelmatomonas gaucii]|uniref:Uncharacterized protein n=1 Tax=Candidatus Sulfuritelmatomonas gaucii TaxID=2043161 RepID=A0A2N9LL34_9BACT|nr:exported hypothetical protein [Candidatus Sulfotelmatomonas gaucii]
MASARCSSSLALGNGASWTGFAACAAPNQGHAQLTTAKRQMKKERNMLEIDCFWGLGKPRPLSKGPRVGSRARS